MNALFFFYSLCLCDQIHFDLCIVPSSDPLFGFDANGVHGALYAAIVLVALLAALVIVVGLNFYLKGRVTLKSAAIALRLLSSILVGPAFIPVRNSISSSILTRFFLWNSSFYYDIFFLTMRLFDSQIVGAFVSNIVCSSSSSASSSIVLCGSSSHITFAVISGVLALLFVCFSMAYSACLFARSPTSTVSWTLCVVQVLFLFSLSLFSCTFHAYHIGSLSHIVFHLAFSTSPPKLVPTHTATWCFSPTSSLWLPYSCCFARHRTMWVVSGRWLAPFCWAQSSWLLDALGYVSWFHDPFATVSFTSFLLVCLCVMRFDFNVIQLLSIWVHICFVFDLFCVKYSFLFNLFVPIKHRRCRTTTGTPTSFSAAYSGWSAGAPSAWLWFSWLPMRKKPAFRCCSGCARPWWCWPVWPFCR